MNELKVLTDLDKTEVVKSMGWEILKCREMTESIRDGITDCDSPSLMNQNDALNI
jgi:hypothetical protein